MTTNKNKQNDTTNAPKNNTPSRYEPIRERISEPSGLLARSNPEGSPLINLELLLKVFQIQNPSGNDKTNTAALTTIIELLPRGCQWAQRAGAMIIHKGKREPRPYYVAHLDQVHDVAEGFELLVHDGCLVACDAKGERVGVGGDDKSGIFVALSMLHALEDVTVILVPDEEIGCCGSREVPLKWFRKAAFVIQADRRHDTYDIIADTNGMNCASDAFLNELEMLSVPCDQLEAWNVDAIGSVTDIGELAERGLRVSMVNISAGYFDAHTSNEYVDLNKLNDTLSLAYQAGKYLGDVVWEHTPQSSWGGYRAPGVSGSYPKSAWSYDEADDYERGEAMRDPEGDSEFDADEYGDPAELEPLEHQDLVDRLTHYGYDPVRYSLDSHDLATLAEAINAHEWGERCGVFGINPSVEDILS